MWYKGFGKRRLFLDYITIDNEKSDKRMYLDEYSCEDRKIINETINNS